jgi:hypothetical protein
MLDERVDLLLRAAIGFAGGAPCLPSTVTSTRSAPGFDSWSGIGHVAVGMARQGYDLQLTRYDEERLAHDVLHQRDGALADERDGHRVGADAVACGAAGGGGRCCDGRLVKSNQGSGFGASRWRG